MQSEKEATEAKRASSSIVENYLLRFLFSHVSASHLSIGDRDALIKQLSDFAAKTEVNRKGNLPRWHISLQLLIDTLWHLDNHVTAKRFETARYLPKDNSVNLVEYDDTYSGIVPYLRTLSPLYSELAAKYFENVNAQGSFGQNFEQVNSPEDGHRAVESDRGTLVVERRDFSFQAIQSIEARLRRMVFGFFVRANDIVANPEPDMLGAHKAQETFRMQVLRTIEYCSLNAIDEATLLFSRSSLDGFGFAFEVEEEAGRMWGLGSKILDLPTSIKRHLDELPLHREREMLANRRGFNSIALAIDWHYTDEDDPVHCSPMFFAKALTRSQHMCDETNVLLTGRAYGAGTTASISPIHTTLWRATQFETLLNSPEILYKPKDEV